MTRICRNKVDEDLSASSWELSIIHRLHDIAHDTEKRMPTDEGWIVPG